MTSDEAQRALETVRREVKRQVLGAIVADYASPEDWRAGALDLAALAVRTDANLNDLARVADQFLCWDSQAFVNLCGVRCGDIHAEDVTRAGYTRLSRINGAPFTYPLHNWST